MAFPTHSSNQCQIVVGLMDTPRTLRARHSPAEQPTPHLPCISPPLGDSRAPGDESGPEGIGEENGPPIPSLSHKPNPLQGGTSRGPADQPLSVDGHADKGQEGCRDGHMKALPLQMSPQGQNGREAHDSVPQPVEAHYQGPRIPLPGPMAPDHGHPWVQSSRGVASSMSMTGMSSSIL
jgi:hypothetical protein